MKVLVIGKGAREYALGYTLSRSPAVTSVYFAPGNGATGVFFKNINARENEFELIGEFIEEENIDLVVVGPEEPIALGIADYLNQLNSVRRGNCVVIAPSQAAAQLEASKAFAKEFATRYNLSLIHI